MESDDISRKIATLHAIAKRLHDQGKDDAAIITELCKDTAITKDYATQILENVYDDKGKRKEFIKHIVLGSFIIIGGLLTNYFSWQFAVVSGSGSFLLIWGVVVTGIIVLIRGFILFKK